MAAILPLIERIFQKRENARRFASIQQDDLLTSSYLDTWIGRTLSVEGEDARLLITIFYRDYGT
jgi:hypothetical protein